MQKKTALVVDDEDIQREILSLLMEQIGFTVLEADNGKTAMEILQNASHIDLVLTDLVMPGQEGLETILQIIKSGKKPAIIAMSGVLFSECYLAMASYFGADQYLSKPIHKEELLNAVRKLGFEIDTK